VQVKELLSTNFKEGLLSSKAELLASSASTLPETSKLGRLLKEDAGSEVSIHHVQLCLGDDSLKVSLNPKPYTPRPAVSW